MIFRAFFTGTYARYAWMMSMALITAIAFEAWFANRGQRILR